MAEHATFVPKLNDRDLINAFQRIENEFPGEVRITFSGQFGALNDSQTDDYKKARSLALVSASVSCPPFSWSWTRLGPHTNPPIPQAADYDRLSFNTNNHQHPGKEQQDLGFRIDTALKRALSRPLTKPGTDDSPLDLATGRDVLQALQGTTQELLVATAEHRAQLEVEFAKRETEREQRFEQLRTQDQERLDQEREAALVAHAERVSTLDARSEELDRLKKSLDDRNNTHVRRQIRSSLLDLTKERLSNFAVSKETRTQYYLVHAVCMTGIILLLGTAIFSAFGIKAAMATHEFATGAIRSALAGAAAVGLGIWYLKWLNRWLQRIADAEFKLQQFRLDIERASWLAETVLEWKQSSTDPFPELLASRLSTGLFQSSATELEDPRTPATQLAEALLGSAASARIKLGDQELAFDRKGLRRLDEPVT